MARTRRGHTPPPTNPNNMSPEAVQTMIDQALLRNSGGRDGSHGSHAENPRNMYTARTEGVVGLTRWIEKMEFVFNISGAGILEADTPPTNMPLLATPRPGCEVGESFTAAARRPGPTMAHGFDCNYVETRL
nr:hypothetical protein [Tanacetum cinerariifolium]